MYESELIIAVRNGNGKIIASQTFEEFMNGRKNIESMAGGVWARRFWNR